MKIENSVAEIKINLEAKIMRLNYTEESIDQEGRITEIILSE